MHGCKELMLKIWVGECQTNLNISPGKTWAWCLQPANFLPLYSVSWMQSFHQGCINLTETHHAIIVGLKHSLFLLPDRTQESHKVEKPCSEYKKINDSLRVVGHLYTLCMAK